MVYRMKNMIKQLRKLVSRLAMLLTVLIIFAFVAAPFWSVAELFTHFVPHYAVCFLLASIFGNWRWIVGAIATAAFTLIGMGEPKVSDMTSSLVFYNSNVSNEAALEDWQALVKSVQPEALALVETDWGNTTALHATYPYGCGTKTLGIFGMVYLSRSPVVSCDVYAQGEFPFIRVETAQGVVVYVLHAPPPIGSLTAGNNGYLNRLGYVVGFEKQPVLVVGDFNQSPYSPTFISFLRDSHTRSQMVNVIPTWRPAWLHIDHVLTGKALVAKVTALPWLHSDHRPLKVQVVKVL